MGSHTGAGKEKDFMAKLNNPLDILKLLDKSNCRKCGEGTCLAFSARVFKGEKRLEDCPRLGSDVLEKFGDQVVPQTTNEKAIREAVVELKKQVSAIDLAASAERVQGTFAHGKLTISILGKNFSVDAKGNITSDIHVHPWVSIPILSYLIDCQGVPVSNKWVPLRELKNGRVRGPLFERQCEVPLRELADASTSFLEDVIHIFKGKEIKAKYDSDISVVLHPLPRLPIMICYWKPDDGLASNLNLFFDASAEQNLNIDSIYALGTGLVKMFKKISITHGYQ